MPCVALTTSREHTEARELKLALTQRPDDIRLHWHFKAFTAENVVRVDRRYLLNLLFYKVELTSNRMNCSCHIITKGVI